ncbi:MAG: dihydrolipoamide acetyltransferase family protein [Myxococcota bacterium]
MAFEFRLPDIGEGVVEGEIVKWHVKAGDSVSIDQPMVEVMTDKATVVIPSPRAGKVVEARGNEGAIAKVGEILVVIEEVGAPAKAAPPPPAAPPPAARPAAQPAVQAQAMHVAVAEALPPPPAPAAQKNGSRPVLAAPATRRLARELGLELATIDGTGPGGRVTSEDVRRASQRGTDDDARTTVAPPPMAPAMPPLPMPAVAGDVEERVPIRGLRKRIFENMARSKQHAAHFTFVEECDCTALVALRDRFNARLKDGEEKIQYLPFIVKAVIAALKKFPDMNGHVDEAKMEFSRRKDFHIGIAAASERGLIVPVVKNADRRSILDLSNEIKRLGDLARAGRLGPEDLGGSTFTITSLGKDGGIFATPIINYPEVAIMGVHKMAKKAMVNEDDSITVKPMMNLSLSFDHRMIDGHVGAAFTYTVIRLLESPDRLLMEMA